MCGHVAVLGAYYGIFNHAVSPLHSARRAAARIFDRNFKRAPYADLFLPVWAITHRTNVIPKLIDNESKEPPTLDSAVKADVENAHDGQVRWARRLSILPGPL